MRDINQFTITEAVKKSFAAEEGSRFKYLLDTLLDHLHDYTRETQITHEEWMRALMFLYDCGKISTPERRRNVRRLTVLRINMAASPPSSPFRSYESYVLSIDCARVLFAGLLDYIKGTAGRDLVQQFRIPVFVGGKPII